MLAAFHYGNISYPSQDPPRIGLLSTIPSDAAKRLQDAVAAAADDGGNLPGTLSPSLLVLCIRPKFIYVCSHFELCTVRYLRGDTNRHWGRASGDVLVHRFGYVAFDKRWCARPEYKLVDTVPRVCYRSRRCFCYRFVTAMARAFCAPSRWFCGSTCSSTKDHVGSNSSVLRF